MPDHPTPLHMVAATTPLSAHKRDILHTAAGNIAAMRRLLHRYRSETPLGHQPSMIAHEVDELLEGTRNYGGDDG